MATRLMMERRNNLQLMIQRMHLTTRNLEGGEFDQQAKRSREEEKEVEDDRNAEAEEERRENLGCYYYPICSCKHFNNYFFMFLLLIIRLASHLCDFTTFSLASKSIGIASKLVTILPQALYIRFRIDP